MTDHGARVAAARARAIAAKSEPRAGALDTTESEPRVLAIGDPQAPLDAVLDPAALRPRVLAIGDPQAPLDTVLAILDRHGALGDDGWLADDVTLISVGDHFDYGASAERRDAADSGLAILAWLAAHPPDQAILVAGNHDLGRVGELAAFDDDSFAEAHAEAARAYRSGDPDPALEAAVLARYPSLPTAELAARDFAAFSVAQRVLVSRLLRARRLRAAVAVGEVLVTHAGVSAAQLAAIAVIADAGAGAIAAALDRALDAAVAGWTGGRLSIPGLHRPGDATFGEGGGMFYHRPANPEVSDPRTFAGAYPRRYDARALPRGIVQVIGHIADPKARQLLGPWADPTPTPAGALRHLVTDGDRVRYQPGTPGVRDPDTAVVVFIDGRMSRTPLDRYQLLDVRALAPAAPR